MVIIEPFGLRMGTATLEKAPTGPLTRERFFEKLPTLFELLKEHQISYIKPTARVHDFSNLQDGLSAYNQSPFSADSLLVRIESRGSEISYVDRYDWDPTTNAYARNGLSIQNAQDPAAFYYNKTGRALTYIDITPDEKNPGKPKTYHAVFIGILNDKPDYSEITQGPPDQKGIRVCYMGEYHGEQKTMIVGRERQDVNGKITSYLKVGIVDSPQSIAELRIAIYRVLKSPFARLDILQQDDFSWIGPNDIIPLVSQDGTMSAGIICNVGYDASSIQEGVEPNERPYGVLITEVYFDPIVQPEEGNGVIGFVRPQIIATEDDFAYFDAAPKRPELRPVIYPCGVTFDINTYGKVLKTNLEVGVRDSYPGRLEYKGNIFTRPINRELFRDKIRIAP